MEKEVSLVHYGVVQVDQGTLFELILAANYLDIKVSNAPLASLHKKQLACTLSPGTLGCHLQDRCQHDQG